MDQIKARARRGSVGSLVEPEEICAKAGRGAPGAGWARRYSLGRVMTDRPEPRTAHSMHLSGCWLVDEDAAACDGARLMAILFLGTALMIFLDLVRVSEGPPVTERRFNTYWLDGARMFVATTRHPGDTMFEEAWELTSDNVLFLQIGPDWVPFHPSTIEGLVDRGFSRSNIESLVTVGEMVKEFFHEGPPYLRAIPGPS
ncbi:MAG: hypothetical protein BroJett029_00020 [Alphaproteobacteria bacterium]|nr:MAG: hypothetical protein BroJett029_00020 [Alphaproteobacteria bacterium]